MKLKLIKLRKENKKNSETINLRGIGSDAIFKNILKAQLILETIDVKFLEVLKSLKTLKYCFKEIKVNIYLIEFIENNEEDFQKNSIELLKII